MPPRAPLMQLEQIAGRVAQRDARHAAGLGMRPIDDAEAVEFETGRIEVGHGQGDMRFCRVDPMTEIESREPENIPVEVAHAITGGRGRAGAQRMMMQFDNPDGHECPLLRSRSAPHSMI